MIEKNEILNLEKFYAKVVVIGNSIGIIIPERVAAWNNLEKGEELRVWFEKKQKDEI